MNDTTQQDDNQVSNEKPEIDWNGESFKQTDEHGNTHELVYFCENCGVARDSHKTQPAGHSQKAVCVECGAETLRKKSVEDILSTSFQEGDYNIEAEIEKRNFDREKKLSVQARVELFQDGEKKLVVLYDVSSGNEIPDEPEMEDKVFQNLSIWMSEDHEEPSKRVDADWQNDEVLEMNNGEFALQVLKWIENDWDHEVLFEYEEVSE